MFASIRRHQHWIWYVVVFIVIVSFVVFFNPSSKMGGGRSSRDEGNYGSINGRPITALEYQNAARETEIFHYLRFQEWPGGEFSRRMGFDMEQETYRRLLLVDEFKRLNVEPGPQATAEMIARLFTGNSDQPFHEEMFQRFMKSILEPHHLTSEDFIRFARHELAREQLVTVYGLPGRLMTPQEGEFLYRQQNEPLASELAIFSASNYLSAVLISPTALQQYYTNRQADYRLLDRRQVEYIKFELTNFTAEADQLLSKQTNVSAYLDQQYLQRGTNFYTDKDGKPLAMAEAKKKILQEERDKTATFLARKQAGAFISQLFEATGEKGPRLDDFEKLALKKNLAARLSEPFDERDGPEALKVLSGFTTTTFRLTDDAPVATQPLPGEDGVYVIALKKRLPSEIQPFETVRAKVTEDYRHMEALKLARQAGEKFAAAATNGLAAGRKFEAIAAETKVNPVALPNFTLSTRTLPELDKGVSLSQLQNVASTLGAGKASPLVPTAEGGFVVYLKSRLPIDAEKMKKELPEFITRKREERQGVAYSEWFRRQAEESRLVMPQPVRQQ